MVRHLLATLAFLASSTAAADAYRTFEVTPGVTWSRTVHPWISVEEMQFTVEGRQPPTSGTMRAPADVVLAIQGWKATPEQLAWANANGVALELDCTKPMPRARHVVCSMAVDFAVLAANPDLETLSINGEVRNVPALRKLKKLRTFDVGTNITDAMVKELATLTQLQRLALERREVTDAHLAQLTKLTELRSLSLTGSTITDAGLVHLRAFPKLTSLRLGATISTGGPNAIATPVLTSAGLEVVGSLSQLRALDLSGSNSGAGIPHLATLTQLEAFRGPNNVDEDGFAVVAKLTKLRALAHYGTSGVTDDSIGHVQKLPLELLDVKYTAVGDKGAAAIGALARLELLGVPREIGDAGMKQLARLSKLRQIDLSDTRVTDDGMKLLPRMKALETVNIANNDARITLASIASLAKLPNLRELIAGGTRFGYKGCPALEATLGRKVCM
ncbi:MAG: hypothetical protein SFX73_26735 [Kofleriaceae bacterium]|nr:hypothetical protein [Kofleriaceae bacterium]